MNVFLDSVGCRLNQSEIEKFALEFRAAGHTIVASPKEADLVVINTCAVTRQAEADSRNKIRQAGRATTGKISVTGCWATLYRDAASALPKVDQVVGNLEKDRLVSDLLNLPPEQFDLEPLAREPLPGIHQRTRAFLKVQDGCDNHCTFCVTRIARGAGRSRSVADVLADVHTAQAGGAQEIVLTGVHLGSWGQDFASPAHLYDLVKAILGESDIPRLRLSSLEPWDLDERFFSLWSDERLCRHLHLPLQSGCESTLRRMARKTSPESFSRLVDLARGASPEMAITTDVIVGFPGETEAEFAESLDFVREMRFAGGHVFNYSARPGTAAERLPGQVPLEVRKQRSQRMRDGLGVAARQYSSGYIGKQVRVLWESTDVLGPDGWHLHGLTDNYLRVHATHPDRLWNQINQVAVVKLEGDELAGVILD